MGTRTIELRWRGRCARCRSPLGAGEAAHYDDATHEISCVDCAARARTAARAVAAHPLLPKTEAEKVRVRQLIADARAALAHAREAS